MSKIMMASGLEFREMRWGIFNGDDPLITYFPDQRQAALEFIQTKDSPGRYFQYNKYHPQLLGLIIERATGLSVTDYTQEKLWNSPGMEFDGSWSLDSEEICCPSRNRSLKLSSSASHAEAISNSPSRLKFGYDWRIYRLSSELDP